MLIADGAPAESYRGDGNRRLFQNVNSHWDHAPAPPPCAPIVTNGPVVAALWAGCSSWPSPGPRSN